MRIIDSIWAFSYDGTLVDKLHGALLGHSLTTYAVIWLIVGITSAATGYMVTRPGSLSADISRRAGMAVAGFNALLAMTWMPYYPVWALVYIAIVPPPPAQSVPDRDPLDELRRLGELHTQGILTDEEFAAAKAKVIGS